VKTTITTEDYVADAGEAAGVDGVLQRAGLCPHAVSVFYYTSNGVVCVGGREVQPLGCECGLEAERQTARAQAGEAESEADAAPFECEVVRARQVHGVYVHPYVREIANMQNVATHGALTVNGGIGGHYQTPGEEKPRQAAPSAPQTPAPRPAPTPRQAVTPRTPARSWAPPPDPEPLPWDALGEVDGVDAARLLGTALSQTLTHSLAPELPASLGVAKAGAAAAPANGSSSSSPLVLGLVKHVIGVVDAHTRLYRERALIANRARDRAEADAASARAQLETLAARGREWAEERERLERRLRELGGDGPEPRVPAELVGDPAQSVAALLQRSSLHESGAGVRPRDEHVADRNGWQGAAKRMRVTTSESSSAAAAGWRAPVPSTPPPRAAASPRSSPVLQLSSRLYAADRDRARHAAEAARAQPVAATTEAKPVTVKQEVYKQPDPAITSAAPAPAAAPRPPAAAQSPLLFPSPFVAASPAMPSPWTAAPAPVATQLGTQLGTLDDPATLRVPAAKRAAAEPDATPAQTQAGPAETSGAAAAK
jgi:hypothetical protein